MTTVRCEGWWEQSAFGRQPMNELQLTVQNGVITGRGTDIIHRFSFSGKITAQGAVEMVKQYEGRHSVLYVGRYDGEGSMFGEWNISGMTGKWWIRFQAPNSIELSEASIQEVVPASD